MNMLFNPGTSGRLAMSDLTLQPLLNGQLSGLHLTSLDYTARV